MRMNPILFTYFLILSVLLFSFVNLFNLIGWISIPEWAYKLYGSIMGVMFFWWPIDMILHSEKRTLASFEKDKYLMGIVLGILAYLICGFGFALQNWESAAVGVVLAVVYPSTILLWRWLNQKRVDIDPRQVMVIGQQSPRYTEFLRYFPHAKKYVIGLNSNDGNRAHLLLHERRTSADAPGFLVDYVMDVPVDRTAGIYVGGKERLSCYVFRNHEGKAQIGFLPSMNIGRALDYGFSDDEMDRAIEQASSPEQDWAPLDDEPLIVRHYPGRIERMG